MKQMISPDSRIYVAGHAGLVGSAVLRRLEREGFTNVLTATREQLDLRDQAAVNYWFRANRPEYVFLVAGTVGGILANSTRPAEFIYDNMMIHATVVHAAHLFDVDEAALPGQFVHLPAGLPAADEGGTPPVPAAGADQRVLRGRQDRRHQALRGLPPAVRTRLHLGHADQSLRAQRQLRPRKLARPAGADPQVPRREARGPGRGRDLGHRQPAPRVSARRRPGRRVPLPDAQLRRGDPTSTSAPART